jgi:hypothetical protein
VSDDGEPEIPKIRCHTRPSLADTASNAPRIG